jgi:hypothetical protein
MPATAAPPKLSIVHGTPKPPARPDRTTPYAPQMWYTRDVNTNNYCLRVANGYGEMVLELRASGEFFSQERQAWLQTMCETAFGVEPAAPAPAAQPTGPVLVSPATRNPPRE